MYTYYQKSLPRPRKTPSPEGSRAAKLFAERPGPETLRGESSLESVAALASTVYLKESPMLAPQAKQQVVAKVIGARDELEGALRLTAPGARYEPIVIPQAMRKEVSVMRDDLDRMIHMLERTQ